MAWAYERQSEIANLEEEEEELSSSSGKFEFVLMGAKGGLDSAGISQIRAHTTRELHRTRRKKGQILPDQRNKTGNIYFGSSFDALQGLPQLAVEARRPGLLDEAKHEVFTLYGQEEMTQSVWPVGSKDDTFFAGMLLMSSIHLDTMKSGRLTSTTMAVKLEAIKLVRERIQEVTPDAIISCLSAIACLAVCALVCEPRKLVPALLLRSPRGQIDGTHEYLVHRKAYAVLIKEAMKLNMFGVSRFCKDVLRVITVIAVARRCGMPTAGLAPPANTYTILKEYEYVFEDQWMKRTEPNQTLYSPVYDGRKNWREDPFPCVKSEHLHLLLEMMQNVIRIWLQRDFSPDAEQTDDVTMLQPLHQRILAMPSANIPSLPCSNDYIYEGCRLTSVLLVRSVVNIEDWKSIASQGSWFHQIRDALKRTDLGNLWGDQLGLLYWVTLVFHCAAFDTPYYLFAHTILLRVYFQLTYAHNDWHGALKPMIALKEIMSLSGKFEDTG